MEEQRAFPETMSVHRRVVRLHTLERYDTGPSPGNGVVTSLLKHLMCAH